MILSNLHTHSVFCDGKDTPEEIVVSAIERGFNSIGFSGHGYTEYDLRYCMKDTDGYVAEINRLKKKYNNKIQIYLGTEEDSFSRCNRKLFDYIIGSSHYFNVNGKYLPVDSSYEYFKKCLEAFDYDAVNLASTYYRCFCEYIKKRRPDIIGHFDLITKFDKTETERFLNNADYNRIAEKYAKEAVLCDCIFEVNTGIISRGFRNFPHPSENILHTIKRNNGRVTISSDCHDLVNLDFKFEEMRKLLRDIGFEFIYVLYNNEFMKDYL